VKAHRIMHGNKVMSANAALALVKDGDTIGLIGGGGGLMEASALFAAIERRFLASGHPRALTVVHALGIGDKATRGLNCFAHEGMCQRVIGGHWVWSPRMQQLAKDEKIQAYIIPGGVMTQLWREIGAGRPGLFTHVGLGTVCDPLLGGGRMNASAVDDIVERITIDGRQFLRYKPFAVHVALIRASVADAHGNLSFEQEAANLDAYAAALAAHNSGGIVIAQVQSLVAHGALKARQVRIPAALVDAIVVDADQRTGYETHYDATLTGEARGPAAASPPEPFSERTAIARRALLEIAEGDVVNYGVGIPDAVARLASLCGLAANIHTTIEHGTYGGDLLTGTLFGYARNADAMIDAPSQFDFYSGGGLDVAFLGFGEFDAQGNVNVSKLGGFPVGPGGFIDIAQNARKVVFCGTFAAKGVKLQTGDGSLRIQREGEVRKLVRAVEQITFSGPQALAQGQTVLYVTERASFRLTPNGVELFEIAPGLDLVRDVLSAMDFKPAIAATLAVLPAENYTQ
jgi:propionate CoA-transferase